MNESFYSVKFLWQFQVSYETEREKEEKKEKTLKYN